MPNPRNVEPRVVWILEVSMAPPQQLAFPPTALRNVAAGLVVGNPVGSGGTRAKALTAAELKAIVEASGISYLPLSGGTLSGDLTLSSGRQLVGTESKLLLSSGAGGQLAGYIATSPVVSISSSGGFRADSALSIGWANLSSGVDATPDLRLYRGGAGILAQRNGLNAQCYELFETYTSSTNFGALRLKATSSGHQIGSARGTSGSNRAVQLGHFDSAGTFTSGLSIATNGQITSGYTAMQDGFRVGSCLSTNWSSIYQVRLHPNTWIGWDSVGETGNNVDIQINRKSTGKLAVRGDNGLCVRNLADSADAALTCGALTASGAVTLPTLTDAAAPVGSIYYSSTAGKMVFKDSGGTVHDLY